MSSSSISSSPTVPHVRSESVEVEAGNIPSSPQPSPIMRQLSMHNYGERPGPIDNADLCGDVAGSIKVNLKEGHGYVLVPPTLWRLLYQWYGVLGDKGNDVNGANIFKRTVICPGRRFADSHGNHAAIVKTDGVNATEDLESSISKLATQFYIPPIRPKGVRVEVHPLLLRYCVMDVRTGRPAYNSKRMAELSGTFSAAITIAAMKARMCAELGVGPAQDEDDAAPSRKSRKRTSEIHTRLWVKPREKTGDCWPHPLTTTPQPVQVDKMTHSQLQNWMQD